MAAEERCPRCGGLNGVHGSVHVRHGNGGGHNEPCPLDPTTRCPHGRTIQSRRDNPCPEGLPGCQVPGDTRDPACDQCCHAPGEHPHPPILLTGTLPDGTPVLVTLWDETGAIRAATPAGIEGQVATKTGDGRFARWDIPARLEEEN